MSRFAGPKETSSPPRANQEQRVAPLSKPHTTESYPHSLRYGSALLDELSLMVDSPRPIHRYMRPQIWYNYAIYGSPNRSFDGLTVSDLEYADTVDPAGISTWSNVVDGLGRFRDRGGKVLTYHGTYDQVRHPISHFTSRATLTWTRFFSRGRRYRLASQNGSMTC